MTNPTPANHCFTDADGEWLLGIQGAFQADGFLDRPEANFDFAEQWISYGQGSYGYGCACFDGEFDPDTGKANTIYKMTPVSLVQCRNDPKLPKEPSN